MQSRASLSARVCHSASDKMHPSDNRYVRRKALVFWIEIILSLSRTDYRQAKLNAEQVQPNETAGSPYLLAKHPTRLTLTMSSGMIKQTCSKRACCMYRTKLTYLMTCCIVIMTNCPWQLCLLFRLLSRVSPKIANWNTSQLASSSWLDFTMILWCF